MGQERAGEFAWSCWHCCLVSNGMWKFHAGPPHCLVSGAYFLSLVRTSFWILFTHCWAWSSQKDNSVVQSGARRPPRVRCPSIHSTLVMGDNQWEFCPKVICHRRGMLERQQWTWWRVSLEYPISILSYSRSTCGERGRLHLFSWLGSAFHLG